MTDEDDRDLTDEEVSRYAAHIDRGWDLLERDEVSQARASAYQAASIDETAPDAFLLLGAAAAADGDLEGASEAYELAIGLAPGYAEAYLALAQLHLYDLHRPDAAGEVCDRGLDVEGLPPIDRLDLRAVAAEAAMADHDDDLARAYLDDQGITSTLARVLSGDLDALATGLQALDGIDDEPPDRDELESFRLRGVSIMVRIARVRLDLEETSRALDLLQVAVLSAPENPEVWYLLSEVHLKQGEASAAVQASARVARLDAAARAPGWLPAAATVHANATQILTQIELPELPESWRDGTESAVWCAEVPARELILEGLDPRAPAILLAQRGTGDGPIHPTALVIYRRNLARICRNAEEIEDALRTAILEEVAAVFEFDAVRRTQLGLPVTPGGVLKPRHHH